MKTPGLLLLLALAVILAACGQARPTATDTPAPPTAAPPPTLTQMPATPTATPIPPTATPTATPVPPTATPTATPTVTPKPLCQVVAAAANLRYGPGVVYAPPIARLPQGTELEPLARDRGGMWIQVRTADRTGWISTDADLISCNVDATSLPEGEIPPTPTPTRTPPYNQPGTYTFEGLCIVIPVDDAHGDECIESVEVRSDGYMQFNFTWTAYVQGSRWQWLIKYSDAGNRNMYVTDNLGNRYDHVDMGGVAPTETRFFHGETIRGWFLFPPAKPGAISLTFHDDDQGKQFEGIVLRH